MVKQQPRFCSRTSSAISRASSLSGTLIPPVAIGISVLPPKGGPVDAVSVGRLAIAEPPIFITRTIRYSGCTQRCENPNVQYNADLVNPSSGKINLEKLKSRKQSDLFSIAKILFLLLGGHAN
jgi:hypothetical protein